MRAVTLATLVLISTGASAQQRKPPPLDKGTSAIRGHLTDAVTKLPVANCSVRAASAGRGSDVVSGPDGAYEFAGIADGAYFLLVRCPSHVVACLELTEPDAPPCGMVTLHRDQQLSNIDFRLTAGAVLRGRVITGSAHGVGGATVRLGRPVQAGSPALMLEPVTTKADGGYELRNLPPGEWRLEVELPPPSGSQRGPTLYYPGVLSAAEAGAVQLSAGGETDGTIKVPAILETTLTVRMPPPDAQMTSVDVSLIRLSPLATRRIELDAEGQSVITGLNEGRHVVRASALWQRQKWVAFQGIDIVEGQNWDVSLQLLPAGRLRGRIVGERGALPPLDGARVAAVWVDEDVAIDPIGPEEGSVAADGTFEIGGLFGRRVLQLIGFDSAWTIDAIMEGRSDVTASGIDIASNATTEVTVVVRPRQN